MKSIRITHSSLEQAFLSLSRLGLKLGNHCKIIKPNYTIEIDLEAIDQVIEQELKRRANSHPAPQEPEPERIDQWVALPQQAKIRLMKLEADFLRATQLGVSGPEAIATLNHGKATLRTEIVLPFAQAHVSGSTLVYGGQLEGATTIEADGRAATCDTLIHFSHPVNPEDLAIRERRITCNKIVRLQVEALDDIAWLKQNQPLHWPLNSRDWRNLLLDRWKAMKLAIG